MNIQHGDKNFILLTDYSSKYKVSVSTLRRKIKNEDIQYVFEDGRYFINDEPLNSPTSASFNDSTHQRNHRPSLEKSEETLVSARTRNSVVVEKTPYFESEQQSCATEKIKESDKKHEESVLTIANRLLAELKKAYSQILQGKEEQIFRLKEEIADLKTLARVLETENSRLSKPR